MFKRRPDEQSIGPLSISVLPVSGYAIVKAQIANERENCTTTEMPMLIRNWAKSFHHTHEEHSRPILPRRQIAPGNNYLNALMHGINGSTNNHVRYTAQRAVHTFWSLHSHFSCGCCRNDDRRLFTSWWPSIISQITAISAIEYADWRARAFGSGSHLALMSACVMSL